MSEEDLRSLLSPGRLVKIGYSRWSSRVEYEHAKPPRFLPGPQLLKAGEVVMIVAVNVISTTLNDKDPETSGLFQPFQVIVLKDELCYSMTVARDDFTLSRDAPLVKCHD